MTTLAGTLVCHGRPARLIQQRRLGPLRHGGDRSSAQSQLTGLLSHVGAEIDRYRAGEIDAYAADETIHRYHRAAAELWKLCFAEAAALTPGSSTAPGAARRK